MTRSSIPRFTLFLVVLWSGSVRADDDAAYQTHYDRAHELVRSGDRHGAIREFEAAYAASPRPEALYNLGMLYKKIALDGGTGEDAQRAIDYLEQYAERYRAVHAVDPPDVKTVSRYVGELRASFHLAAPAAPSNPAPPSPVAAPAAPPPPPEYQPQPTPPPSYDPPAAQVQPSNPYSYYSAPPSPPPPVVAPAPTPAASPATPSTPAAAARTFFALGALAYAGSNASYFGATAEFIHRFPLRNTGPFDGGLGFGALIDGVNWRLFTAALSLSYEFGVGGWFQFGPRIGVGGLAIFQPNDTYFLLAGFAGFHAIAWVASYFGFYFEADLYYASYSAAAATAISSPSGLYLLPRFAIGVAF